MFSFFVVCFFFPHFFVWLVGFCVCVCGFVWVFWSVFVFGFLCAFWFCFGVFVCWLVLIFFFVNFASKNKRKQVQPLGLSFEMLIFTMFDI